MWPLRRGACVPLSRLVRRCLLPSLDTQDKGRERRRRTSRLEVGPLRQSRRSLAYEVECFRLMTPGLLTIALWRQRRRTYEGVRVDGRDEVLLAGYNDDQR